MWFINASLRKDTKKNKAALIYTDYVHPDIPKDAKILKLFEDKPNLYMIDSKLHIYDRLTGRRMTKHTDIKQPRKKRKKKKIMQED